MTDGYIQVPPNSTGSKVDTSELTVNSQTVERQRVVLADGAVAANLAGVEAGGALLVSQGNYEALMLGELKCIRFLLELLVGANVTPDDLPIPN